MVDSASGGRVVLDSEEVNRAIIRMAHEILEANRGPDNLIMLGIPTRGVPLAERLAKAIESVESRPVLVGRLDVTMYRDDLRNHPTRSVGKTVLPGDINAKTVVLVDDVLYSGRTVSAALDALKDIGRPAAVRLAVLVDRGHRQLPIRADVVGKNLPTSSSERVRVHLGETDETTEVTISREGDS